MTRKIHKEGNVIVGAGFLIFALCAALCFSYKYLALYLLTAVILVLLLFVTWFFRKPERNYITDDNLVFAPADGKVIICEEVDEDEYFNERRMQISIFMSIWNVHANSFPVSGKIEYCKHHQGKYFIAWYPKAAAENERTTIAVSSPKCTIVFRQVAGIIARRIVCYAEKMVGEEVKQNQKLGFIRFGSRVDVFLPLDAKIEVKLGQMVKSTQTVLAQLK